MRIALVLAYDGFAYNGWQSQPDGNTIQDHLETTLSQLSHEAIKVIGAGRTDAGVSARAMVAHFDTNRHLETWKWVRGTNTYLPYDIRVLKAIEVDEAFHARFDSKVKTYRYTIDRRGNNPFSFHFADQCFLALDVEKMSDAATVFLGTHDFTSFNSSDPSLNMIRTVLQIDIRSNDDFIVIDVKGPGFLRFMVRMMVGTLMEVGKGKLTKADVQTMLDNARKGSCRYKAPANGLMLWDIDYPLYPQLKFTHSTLFPPYTI